MTGQPPGVIEPGHLYTAQEAKQRLGLGPKGWKRLRTLGLRIVYEGRQGYVLGDELIRVLWPARDADYEGSPDTSIGA